uniref:Uncharacterized protein n=1 Tax=Amphimedon queenslandica TaxID=400682 RepID=A0A1X7TJJ4_AMPQE
MARRQILFTKGDVDRMRAENRRKEVERTEQLKMVAQDKLMRANMASEEKVEKKILARILQQEATEKETDEKIAASIREKS